MCQIKEGKPSVPRSMSVFLMKSWCIRSSKMIAYFLTVPKLVNHIFDTIKIVVNIRSTTSLLYYAR